VSYHLPCRPSSMNWTISGVGPKSAQRIAFWLMRQRVRTSLGWPSPSKSETRLSSVNVVATSPRLGLCPICADDRRDQTTICVVENLRTSWRSNAPARFTDLSRAHGVLNPLEA